MRYRHRRREPESLFAVHDLTEEEVARCRDVLDEMVAKGIAWRDQFGVYRHIDEGHAGNA